MMIPPDEGERGGVEEVGRKISRKIFVDTSLWSSPDVDILYP